MGFPASLLAGAGRIPVFCFFLFSPVILSFAQNLLPCLCLFFCLSFPKGICFCLSFVILRAAKNPRIYGCPIHRGFIAMGGYRAKLDRATE